MQRGDLRFIQVANARQGGQRWKAHDSLDWSIEGAAGDQPELFGRPLGAVSDRALPERDIEDLRAELVAKGTLQESKTRLDQTEGGTRPRLTVPSPGASTTGSAHSKRC